ncbi:MAG: hypothetical protein ABI645_11295 [Pseudomonadota bacterium]
MLPRITAAITVVLLAGCSGLPKSGQDPAPPAAPSIDLVQAGQLAAYAAALNVVVQGNATAQAEGMNSARTAYEGAKAGPAALLYGLLLAAPGHPLRDMKLAQRVLQEAMAQSELLTPAEQALGKVELARIATEQRLVTEIDRLVAELQQEPERAQTAPAITALNKRLQAEMEETARLRKALDEARAKLDAITRMERNFSDRPPAPEGRNP